MMGSAVRRSTATNAAAATSVPAIRPRITGSVQAYLPPPQVANRTRQVVATASSTMPPMSRRGRPLCRGSLRNRTAPASASSPSGMLIQKTQRQPGPSVKKPPSSGPATEDTANTPPMTPMYLPRSRAGTTSAIAAWERMISPPPPRPWIARAAMRTSMVPASAPTTEPAMNTRIAPRSRGLRPIRSPSLPYTGIMIVEARM